MPFLHVVVQVCGIDEGFGAPRHFALELGRPMSCSLVVSQVLNSRFLLSTFLTFRSFANSGVSQLRLYEFVQFPSFFRFREHLSYISVICQKCQIEVLLKERAERSVPFTPEQYSFFFDTHNILTILQFDAIYRDILTIFLAVT